MKITVFTSNQPRHVALVERLAEVSDQIFAVLECNTVFPGRRQDFFNKSPVMMRYFRHVQAAETALFGHVRPLPSATHVLPLKMGDLNLLSREAMASCLDSDVYVVFGASFIKGWLCEHLVAHQALNIHMGISPYYRGSSCNFWALYDRRPHMVGATVHRLSAGLDSGPMLFHALPECTDENPFRFTMRSVVVAQEALQQRLVDRSIFSLPPVEQDRQYELRYTRNADFTDEVAAEFLDRLEAGDAMRTGEPRHYPAGLLSPIYA